MVSSLTSNFGKSSNQSVQFTSPAELGHDLVSHASPPNHKVEFEFTAFTVLHSIQIHPEIAENTALYRDSHQQRPS
jgi:hypothetical protein